MPRMRRPELTTINDWEEFERSWRRASADIADLRTLRRDVYAEIEAARGRQLLVYFAEIEDPRKTPFSKIELNDIDGFADLVNKCPPSDSVDVLLHSGGGSAETTARIVEVLRAKFDEVHFLIPHSAYSAATMLALSGDSVTLHPIATLGPIDPQMGTGPAAAFVRGFENAKKAIAANPAFLPIYAPLTQDYSLQLLERCGDAAELAKLLVRLWLTRHMFKNQPARKDFIEAVVDYFSDYGRHHTHAHPIGWSALRDAGLVGDGGLKIGLADGGLSELLREAYILLRGFFSVSRCAKLYESADFSFGLLIPAPAKKFPPRLR